MKKQLLLFVMILLPIMAKADDRGKWGENVTYTFVKSTGTLTISGSGAMQEISEGYGPWVNYRREILTVVIEEGVTTIGSYVFRDCSSLNSVTIGNSVKSIGEWAFSFCTSLTSVTIPNSVTTIGISAFYGCSGLTSVTIPNSVTTIGRSAFRACSSLISVTIPNSVETIDNETFANCSSLISVTICNGVKKIDRSTFEGCYKLNSITIPSSVTSIGPNAFKNLRKTIWLTNTPPSGYNNASGTVNYVANNQYTSLKNVVVYPFLSSVFEVDGVKYVPVSPSERTCDAIDCVYNSSAATTKVASTVSYMGVNMSVQKVQPYVCYGNIFIENLTYVNEGEIPQYAFSNCENLKTVTLGEKVSALDDHSFDHCASLHSIVLPCSVKSIGSSSFSGCKKLSKISIPKSVASISNDAFSYCSELKELIIEDRDTELILGQDSPYSIFSLCPLDYVYIGGKISYNTSFNSSPFYRITTLRKVVITDKETEISANEFYGCSNLQEITIGDGVEKFGNRSFSGCSSLKNLSFGSKLKAIGKEAFSDCTAVTEIICKAATPPTCDTQALDDINKWNCKLFVPVGSLTAYQSANQWKDFFFISEIENTEGVAEISTNTILVQSNDGKLIIHGADDGIPVNIYSANGIQVGSAVSNNGLAVVNTNLQSDTMVIVKIGDKSVKVLIK